MTEKVKKYRRAFLIGLIVICMGIMALGAVVYLEKTKDKLESNAIQNVMDVTIQQRQAFENFIAKDRERLHSYAEHFAGSESVMKEDVQEKLKMRRAVSCAIPRWRLGSSH